MRYMTTNLLFKNFHLLADTPGGVKKLRQLILQLAVQGRLVPQNPDDEPASVLLEKIREEKKQLVKEGKIKKQNPLPEIMPEEIPFELPQGWEWVRLGNVTTYGLSEKIEPKLIGDNVWVLELEDVEKITSRLLKKQKSCERKPKSTKTVFSRGDVLYGKLRPYLDKVIIADEPGVCTTEMIPLNGFGFIDDHYIRWFLKTSDFITYANNSTHGMNLPRLSTEKARLALLPLPPLPEQHRIVAKVVQLMALCDELEAKQEKQKTTHARLNKSSLHTLTESRTKDELTSNWTRIKNNFNLLFTTPESIQELRSSILQLAVQGRLVPKSPDDEPASELLQQIKAEKDELVKEGKIKKQEPLPEIRPEEVPFELPDGWEWCRVQDLAQLITSGSRDWAQYYSNKGAVFFTMGNLSRNSYRLNMGNIRHVSPPENSEGSRTKLEENDLLISITGDVGNLGLIPRGFGEAYINQHICLLRFMPICRNRYFPEFMRSPLAKFQFGAPQRGVKNSFRLGDVGEMIIPTPPLPEQHRIVAKVDQLMALCDELESSLTKSQANGQNLMRSVVAGVSRKNSMQTEQSGGAKPTHNSALFNC